MLGGGGSTGMSSPEWTSKMVIVALLITFFTPLFFTLFVPTIADETEDPYAEQISELEEQYYLATGNKPTATTEVWGLKGIFTPFNGTKYSYSDDGWIYSERIDEYSPFQYTAQSPIGDAQTYYKVKRMGNGLYYYIEKPKVEAGEIVTVTAIDKDSKDVNSEIIGYDYKDATLYTAVSMDTQHPSTIFFTTTSKHEANGHYYYDFNGYRYSFSPLRSFGMNVNGNVAMVEPNSTSLNLIWYQYATNYGIAGQLAVNAQDQGVSYLSAGDIVRAYNPEVYSSTFDMVFGSGIPMHLTIRLDAYMMSQYAMSVEECFNAGYWSVIVSSDAVASSSIQDSSYDFSLDNIFDTLINLFTFKITEKYDIPGWEGTLASLLITMPLYAVLIAVCLSNYYLLIMVALLGVIQMVASGLQSVGDWWPF